MDLPEPLKPGDVLRASWLNRLLSAIASRVRVGPGLTFHYRAGHMTLGLSGHQIIPVHRSTFSARITGNASLATNRWKYSWVQVVRSGDTYADVSGGLSGTTTVDYALNRAEAFHTATYAWGADATAAAALGFNPRPIGGGGTTNTHKYDVVVDMSLVTDSLGVKRYEFGPLMGSYDGECA